MAHDHDHQHDRTSFFTEQLCTIAICGALGAVAITMAWPGSNRLFFLASMFHVPVLLGGSALLVLVAVRAIAVWQMAGQFAKADSDHHHEGDCGHQHDHGEHDHCDHDHGEHEHAHGDAGQHAHAHSHGHDHGHSHGPADHGHDHAWNPWRFAVLLLPVVLYFLNLPNQGFSSDWLRARGINADQLQVEGTGNFSPEIGILFEAGQSGELPRIERVNDKTPAHEKLRAGDVLLSITRSNDSEGNPISPPEVVETKGLSLEAVLQKLQGKPGKPVKLSVRRAGEENPLDFELERDHVMTLRFKELEEAKFSERLRQWYSGRRGQIKGQYAPGGRDRFFTLVRLKMTCCAADVIPLNVVIEAPESVTEYQPGDWIKVEGTIQFLQDPARRTYVPYMKVSGMENIQRIPAEPDVFIQF